MNSQLPTSSSPTYIVRWEGHPVRFFTNCVARKCYALVDESEATRFPDASSVVKTALEHGLDLPGCEAVSVL